MMKPKNTDWNLIIQSNISLLWCESCMDPRNREKKVGELICDFRQKYNDVNPLNIGSLLMASFSMFVYPQQTEFDRIDFSQIDNSKFTVIEGTPLSKRREFLRRIRNSLSHGRFDVANEEIVFCDQKNDGSDIFKCRIGIQEFGDFINEFMNEAKNQYFKRRKCEPGGAGQLR